MNAKVWGVGPYDTRTDVSLALFRLRKVSKLTECIASLSDLNRRRHDLKAEGENASADEWYTPYYSRAIEDAIRFLVEAAEDELAKSRDRLEPHAFPDAWS